MVDSWAPEAGSPKKWIVIFKPKTDSRLVRALAWGRFKHVGAMAYLEGTREWLTFDVGFDGTKITVLPAGPVANATLAPWVEGCTLVAIEGKHYPRRGPPIFGWCVPAVARLIGARGGALRPDTLYRHCLANGGVVLNGRHIFRSTVAAARPDSGAAADTGAERERRGLAVTNAG